MRSHGPSSDSDGSTASGARALVVGDRSLAATLRETAPAEEGRLSLLWAPAVDAALDRAASEAPDCLLVDGTGLAETGSAVSRLRTASSLPVVLLVDGAVGPAALTDGGTTPVPRDALAVEADAVAERVLCEARGPDVTTQQDDSGAAPVSPDRDAGGREYEQLFHAVTDVVTVYDPWAERMVDANQSACDLLGYDCGTLRSLGVEGVSATEEGYTGERAYECLRRVAETGDPETVDWKVHTRDGETRLLETKLTPATVAGERRVLAISRDVTERRETERRLQLVADRIDQIIYVTDLELTEVYYVNSAYEEVNGRPVETLFEDPMAFREQVHEADREEFMTAIEEATAELTDPDADAQDSYELEWRIRRPDGEVRWLRGTTYPVLAADEGSPVEEDRLVTVVEDVTERKRREREYEQIVNAVNDVVTVHDPETGELLEANDTLCELTGYDREAVLARGLDGVSATEEGYTEARAAEIISEVMDADEPHETEWLLEDADGEHVWLEVRATPATINGEERLLTIGRDVTERRRAEKYLREIADRVDEVVHVGSPDLREVYYMSPGYEELWGRPVEEMYEDPSSVVETVHPEDREAFQAEIEETRRDLTDPDREVKETYEHEYRVVHPDGEVRWVNVRGYPVCDAAGNVIRYISLNRDVTERRERERTLESFHEATVELTTAESPSDASRAAVEAAAEVFDLPHACVHLYDETTGDMRPVAATPALADADLPPLGPGDDPGWSASRDTSKGTMGERS